MSIVSLATGEPTCTLDDLKAICRANNFSIEPGSVDETAFLLCQNSFDTVCQLVQNLPNYEDPRVAPCAVEGGDRKYYKPSEDDNPLNAWSHRTTLKSVDPKAVNGPLAGKIVAIKDNVSVAGLPLGLGTSASILSGGKHPISPIDATVVGRILAAGGTIKGTATCENLSLSPLSYTTASGVVDNAWLPGYGTGGSSSGCAVLISIGDVEEARRTGKDKRDYPLGEGVDMGIGGDQGGSIRLPAAHSGIYGIKATHGLVPYTGIAPLIPMIDHTGPMARSVEDVALLLGVIAGYDGLDPRMTPESPLRSGVPDYLGDLKSWLAEKESRGEWNSTSAAKGLRIGILKESFEMAGLDPSIVSAVKTAAERFKSLGAVVKEISIPWHKHGPALWTVAARPMIPHFLENRPPDMLAHTMPHLDPLPIDQGFFDAIAHRNPSPINVLLTAAHMEYKYGPPLARKAYMHVFELRAAYDKAFEDVDVLLAPSNSTLGPKHPKGSIKTAENPKGLSERVMDLFEPAIGNTANTCSFNLTGHPAMSIPTGWGKVKGGDGRLPIGMQIVAKQWDEASIFKAAKAWEMGGKWTDS